MCHKIPKPGQKKLWTLPDVPILERELDFIVPTWDCRKEYDSHVVRTGSLFLIEPEEIGVLADLKKKLCIDDIVFIFEIPGKKWYKDLKPEARKALVAEGELNPKRLGYMEKVIVVPQPYSSCAVTVCEDGHYPHYQVKLEKLESLPSHCRRKLELASSFGECVQQYILPQPWKFGLDSFERLAETTKSFVCESNSGKMPDGRGQRYIVDLGFASGMCHLRNAKLVQADGTSKPAFKKDPMQYFEDRDLTGFLVPICNLLKVLKIDGFLPNEAFGMSAERLRDFAARMGGVFEAFRIAVTDEGHMCFIHMDEHNCPLHPHFVVFSKVVKLDGRRVRISLILYTRKSIKDYYDRRDSVGEWTEALVEFWHGLPKSRKSSYPAPTVPRKTYSYPVPPSDLNKDQQQGACPGSRFHGDFFGLPMFSRPCGMDPGTYLGSSVHAMTLMVCHLRLSYEETVSALVAWSHLASAPVFFVSACHIILGDQKEVPPVAGVGFGHFLLNLMLRVRNDFEREREELPAGSRSKIPAMRYGMYGSVGRDFQLPSLSDWGDMVADVLAVFRDAFLENSKDVKEKKAPPPTEDMSRADEDARYKKFATKTAKLIPGCGKLGSTHVIAFAAVIGLVPFWMLNTVEINPASTVCKAIAKKFGVTSDADTIRMAVSSMRFAFENHILPEALGCEPGEVLVSKRVIENFWCKYYRCTLSIKDGDKLYADLHVHGQFLLNIMYRGKIVIIEEETGISHERYGPLFDTWYSFTEQRFFPTRQYVRDEMDPERLAPSGVDPSQWRGAFRPRFEFPLPRLVISKRSMKRVARIYKGVLETYTT